MVGVSLVLLDISGLQIALIWIGAIFALESAKPSQGDGAPGYFILGPAIHQHFNRMDP